MFTNQELDRHVDLISASRLQVERKRIADFLRERAEAHPKWEMHKLLNELATKVEANQF